MRIITSEDIEKLDISPSLSVEWGCEALLIKDRCILTPKISLHPWGNDFFNTMPHMPYKQLINDYLVSNIAA